jgi:uncharacterized protein
LDIKKDLNEFQFLRPINSEFHWWNPLLTSKRNGRTEMTEHRGGKGNFAEDPKRASEAGKKGGQNSGGNFKNNPQRASEAGQKGGEKSRRS